MTGNVHLAVYQKNEASSLLTLQNRFIGTAWFASRIYAQTGTALTAPRLSLQNSSGTEIGLVVGSSTRSGGNVTVTGDVLVGSGGGTATKILMEASGTDRTDIADASISPGLVLTGGATVKVTWTLSPFISNQGNYVSDGITAIRDSASGADIGQLWDNTVLAGLAQTDMAQAMRGETTPKWDRFTVKMYKVDAARSGQPPVLIDDDNPVHLIHDEDIACTFTSTTRTRNLTLPFPGNSDAGAFRYRWGQLVTGTGARAIGASQWTTFNDIPTSGTHNITASVRVS